MIYKNINIEWLGHSGFRIKDKQGNIIYVDPYKIRDDSVHHEADFIFITHSHQDHCSIEDIQKIAKEGTVIVCTPDCQSKFRHIDNRIKIHFAEPGKHEEFEEKNMKFWGVAAYNTDKRFHEKEEDWVGYILDFDNTLVYHAGDTDFIPEMKNLENIDIALLPIGGTYTMNAGEAAKAAGIIKPKIAIPMHYGTLEGIGTKEDVEIFVKLCSQEGVEARVLEKS